VSVMPGLMPRLSGSVLHRSREQVRKPTDRTRAPRGRICPATHVCYEGCIDRREGVDDRDKPGQGDLEFFLGHSKQPISPNRTAVASCRASTETGNACAVCVDGRNKSGHDDRVKLISALEQ
jgi:hypothetical protein